MSALLGVLLAPTALGALAAAAQAMGAVVMQPGATLPFSAGFLGYLALHYAWFRPVRLYVFAHELTHAWAAWLSGAKVYRFHVGALGGHVDLSESNAVITLAPYIFPVYSIATLAAYRVCLWGLGDRAHALRWMHLVFLGVMGATLAFHWAHTAEAVRVRRQPDLRQGGGIVFSLSVIAFLNGLVLLLLLKCLFPGAVALASCWRLMWTSTRIFWTAAGSVLLHGFRFVRERYC